MTFITGSQKVAVFDFYCFTDVYIFNHIMAIVWKNMLKICISDFYGCKFPYLSDEKSMPSQFLSLICESHQYCVKQNLTPKASDAVKIE